MELRTRQPESKEPKELGVFLALRYVEPREFHPKGSWEFAGFFQTEQEIEPRLSDGEYVILSGPIHNGEPPKQLRILRRFKLKTPKPKVTEV